MPLWCWRAGFVLACLVQLYALYSPKQAGPELGMPGIDKLGHLLAFAAVAYLGLKVGVRWRLLVPLLVLNAVISEVIQYQVLPQRSGDPFDTVADLAGLAVGTWLGLRAVRSTNAARHDMMGT